MTCSQCSTRLLRSFITATADRSLPTAHAASRRCLTRTSIRHASSSSPRNQSAELSSPASPATTASGTPDFLALYTNAKKNPNKEALSAWGNSWKPETDLSAIRSSSLRLTPDARSEKPRRGNRNIEGNQLTSFDFLDDFTSSAVYSATEGGEESQAAAYKELNSSKYNTEFDPVPAQMKRGFPTRARGDVAVDMDEDGMIPWEDAAGVEQRMQDAEDPDAAAWRDLSTPALWARSKKRRMVKSEDMPNGSKFSRRLALESPTGTLKWKPMNSVDADGEAAAAAAERSERDPDEPAWKTHRDAVKAKHSGSAWNPFTRLSPAAVATLKQLKAENPNMTVEEYAPIFKISPDSLRRILRSKWTPSAKEEEDRMERWRRRGDSVWKRWVDNGMVVTRASKRAEKEERDADRIKAYADRKEAKAKQGFILRKQLNLKNRIL
ncbi:hypothetical protein Dda_4491 [Drechslerella dactyloides]|uniref:Required for respiratory growth protein 9, mitochondrial n=1 Tax=Drechslerella dactyloides TaxID=74499 RepID=A0AAD6IXP8_DREDA|nr:hypothetical protein Dda_4491 [Drechslerella dactyloides]